MGGHGHGPPYTIPDYKQFKIEGIPQLEELEKALAKKGLRDPWISPPCAVKTRNGGRSTYYDVIECMRNEAWRYHPGFGTRFLRARKLFFRGFPLGLGLTIATVAITKLIGGDDEHEHH